MEVCRWMLSAQDWRLCKLRQQCVSSWECGMWVHVISAVLQIDLYNYYISHDAIFMISALSRTIFYIVDIYWNQRPFIRIISFHWNLTFSLRLWSRPVEVDLSGLLHNLTGLLHGLSDGLSVSGQHLDKVVLNKHFSFPGYSRVLQVRISQRSHVRLHDQRVYIRNSFHCDILPD